MKKKMFFCQMRGSRRAEGRLAFFRAPEPHQARCDKEVMPQAVGPESLWKL
jgi:hypothetical protein